MRMELSEIPTNFFGRFKEFEEIKLDNNLISTWSDCNTIFGEMEGLKLLS